MGCFFGDIAYMLELFGFVFGLILIHHAKKDGGLLRIAAAVMIIGSILVAICTSMTMHKMRSEKCMEHCSKDGKAMSNSRE